MFLSPAYMYVKHCRDTYWFGFCIVRCHCVLGVFERGVFLMERKKKIACEHCLLSDLKWDVVHYWFS